MDVWSLTRAALRRWYLLLPALLATALIAAAAGDRVAPEYETTGAALLVPPSYSGGPNNPYAAASGAQALSIVANGSAVRQRLQALGLEPGYELTVTARTPIFNIRVRSADPVRATATGVAVIDALREELLRGQREFQVPPAVMATIKVLDQPDNVTQVGSGATRVKATVALVGAILSIALAVTIDDILLLIRARRAARPARRKLTTASSRHDGSDERRRERVVEGPSPAAAPASPAAPSQEPAPERSAGPPTSASAPTPTTLPAQPSLSLSLSPWAVAQMPAVAMTPDMPTASALTASSAPTTDGALRDDQAVEARR